MFCVMQTFRVIFIHATLFERMSAHSAVVRKHLALVIRVGDKLQGWT
jgi:hypothetical protein